MNRYKKLVDQIQLSVLSIVLKCSAFNNLQLAKILHHCYNTKLSKIRIELMKNHLVSAVRELLKLYKQLAMFLPRDHEGFVVKKICFVY